MKRKQEIIDRINELTDMLLHFEQVKYELWQYHPANPDFINPITSYEQMTHLINEIENEIGDSNNELLALN
jgi:hypothetical protein